MYGILKSTCSENVIRAIDYLEAEIESNSKYYHSQYIDVFYVLEAIKSPLVERFIDDSNNDEQFWLGNDKSYAITAFEHPIQVFHFIKMGFGVDFIDEIDDLKRNQTVSGEIMISDCTHTGPLRILALVEPDSTATKNAAKYFIDSWKNYDLNYFFNLETFAAGMLALSELDYYEYKDQLEEMATFLKNFQNSSGLFGKAGKESYCLIDSHSLAIAALARISGKDDPAVLKAVSWLENQQERNSLGHGFWDDLRRTALSVIALYSVGQGPKISVEDIEWQRELEQQRLKRLKPYFLHTSPIYNGELHIKEIHDKVRDMLKSAKSEIRIASLYIDSLYEDIINLSKARPELKIKVISRPPKDIEGLRERIAKNVLELLKIASKGNMRVNSLFHCRMIIVDEDQMLVSSSDLTRDQLYDQFNGGIYTRHPDEIHKAILFFDNIWGLSSELGR